MMHLTPREKTYCQSIQAKDVSLRTFLAENSLAGAPEANQWLCYLTGIKYALGNLNNDLSFVATLLVKDFLKQHFNIENFDAAAKAQGASGIDVECQASDGKVIVGEIKTTKPYQPGFGAAQRTTILKDLTRLVNTPADYRFMFVIDPDAYRALCS